MTTPPRPQDCSLTLLVSRPAVSTGTVECVELTRMILHDLCLQPWQWICPEYVILQLKLFSVSISG